MSSKASNAQHSARETQSNQCQGTVRPSKSHGKSWSSCPSVCPSNLSLATSALKHHSISYSGCLHSWTINVFFFLFFFLLAAFLRFWTSQRTFLVFLTQNKVDETREQGCNNYTPFSRHWNIPLSINQHNAAKIPFPAQKLHCLCAGLA